MTRSIAGIQLAFGLLGMVLVACGYWRFAQPLTTVLHSWAEVSAATSAELQVLQETSDQSVLLAQSYQDAIESSIQSVQRTQHGLTQFDHSLAGWESQLQELASTSAKSSDVAGRFATLLPLKLPVLEYTTDKIRLDIPNIKLKEQVVELPYPTARLSSRGEKLDLGVTKIEVNVPTLELGTAAKKVQLPAFPDVTTETTEFQIPTNFNVVHQSILEPEKQLVLAISNDFDSLSQELNRTAMAMQQTRQLVQGDIRESLGISERALRHTAQMLAGLQQIQLPRWREQVAISRRSIDQAQPAFQNLSGLVPWLFAVSFLIPIGLVVNGAWMWRTSAHDAITLEKKYH